MQTIRRCLLAAAYFFSFIPLFAQNGRMVLIEEFVETACSACAQYDSAFQALTDANGAKVIVLNFHCNYSLDPFYQYNKACDQRYVSYGLDGYPSAMMNGKKPMPSSAHLSYVTPARIEALYNQPPLFEFEIKSKAVEEKEARIARIEVKTKALEDLPGADLKLYIVVTENNINYEKRYGSKAVNGLNEFNHIVRAMLPDENGTAIGEQKAGTVSKAEFTYTNDDKEIDFREVRIVAFVQDNASKEVLGAAVMKEHPF